jgi:flagellar FliL protein
MSDAKAKPEATEKPEKKKKGKLPIIIVLVLVLAGGGFFMMKGKGGEKKKEPPITLGEKVSLGDFLVNLRDGKTFLQTNIVVHLAKGKKLGEGGGGEGEGEAAGPSTELAALQSAIIVTLSSKTLDEIRTPEGKLALQRELAEVLNKEIELEEKGAGKEEKKEGEKAKEGEQPKEGEKAKEGEKDAKAKEGEAKKEPEHPDWDSDKGPVLKIYFTKFATQ